LSSCCCTVSPTFGATAASSRWLTNTLCDRDMPL
jgi:hypothetical protein